MCAENTDSISCVQIGLVDRAKSFPKGDCNAWCCCSFPYDRQVWHAFVMFMFSSSCVQKFILSSFSSIRNAGSDASYIINLLTKFHMEFVSFFSLSFIEVHSVPSLLLNLQPSSCKFHMEFSFFLFLHVLSYYW